MDSSIGEVDSEEFCSCGEVSSVAEEPGSVDTSAGEVEEYCFSVSEVVLMRGSLLSRTRGSLFCF